MENEILSKCGYRCDLCLAFQPNVKKNDQRKALSDGWHKIYGFRIPPDKIYCEGCVSYESPRLIDTECSIRPCVTEKGFKTCAQCDEFVCETHKQRGVSRQDLENKLGRKIDDADYKLYVEPYESEERLRKLKEKHDE